MARVQGGVCKDGSYEPRAVGLHYVRTVEGHGHGALDRMKISALTPLGPPSSLPYSVTAPVGCLTPSRAPQVWYCANRTHASAISRRLVEIV